MVNDHFHALFVKNDSQPNKISTRRWISVQLPDLLARISSHHRERRQTMKLVAMCVVMSVICAKNSLHRLTFIWNVICVCIVQCSHRKAHTFQKHSTCEYKSHQKCESHCGNATPQFDVYVICHGATVCVDSSFQSAVWVTSLFLFDGDLLRGKGGLFSQLTIWKTFKI